MFLAIILVFALGVTTGTVVDTQFPQVGNAIVSGGVSAPLDK